MKGFVRRASGLVRRTHRDDPYEVATPHLFRAGGFGLTAYVNRQGARRTLPITSTPIDAGTRALRTR
jgi:hypothetical protein